MDIDQVKADSQASAGTRRLFKAIRRIARANDLHSRVLAKATGLTMPQLVVLMGVHEMGEVTTAALSAHAELSPATVVTILDNLEERGLVERYRSTLDRRIVHTRLTAAGLALLRRAPDPLDAGFLARFAAIPEARQRQIVRHFTEVADMMHIGDDARIALGAPKSDMSDGLPAGGRER